MKIHIVSGFLGSGKTTFINRLLPTLKGKICLIENEFGDVSIDGNLFPQKLEVKEIYAGCICCSLVANFKKGITDLYEQFKPDHLIIEPSGVGALSEVIEVCKKVINENSPNIILGNVYTIVDVTSYEDYRDHFGSFYMDQITSSPTIFLSYVEEVTLDDLKRIVDSICQVNKGVTVVSEDWLNLDKESFDNYLSLSEIKLKTKEVYEKIVPAHQLLQSFSLSNIKKFTLDHFIAVFNELPNFTEGRMIRAKGIIQLTTEEYVHFDYTPFHQEWRYIEGTLETGVAFIGTQINKKEIKKIFIKRAILVSR